jgi:hypothetical protein
MEQCGGIQKFWLCKSKEESNQLDGSSLGTAFLSEKLVEPGSILKSITKVRGPPESYLKVYRGQLAYRRAVLFDHVLQNPCPLSPA